MTMHFSENLSAASGELGPSSDEELGIDQAMCVRALPDPVGRESITYDKAITPLNPTVTVITPAHNSGAWLDETIWSVRQQTYEDFRYIIVDDSSTDDSLAIARHHANEDSRLSVYSANFGSPARSRQTGIHQAESPFIAFLDGDDVWRPNYLETMSRQFNKLGADVLALYCFFGLINEQSESINRPGDPARGIPQPYMAGRVNFDDYLLGDTPARTASSVMIRNSALQGNQFRQAAEPCEDYDLWMHVLHSNPGSIFYGIPEELFDYRIREGQLSGDVRRLFTRHDRLYAKFVPQMYQPEARWQVYEYAGSGAQIRGLPEFAQHFHEISRRLSENPDFRPYILDGTYTNDA